MLYGISGFFLIKINHMPVIRTYRMQYPDGKRRVVFGSSKRTAVFSWLVRHRKWSNPKNLNSYIHKNKVLVQELDSWRIIDLEENIYYVFAVSLMDVIELSPVDERQILRIQRCDPYYVLLSSSQSQLSNWVRQVWPMAMMGHYSKAEVVGLFPKLTKVEHHHNKNAIGDRFTFRELKNSWAAMLRLAMELPFLAPEILLEYNAVNPTTTRRVTTPMEQREYMEPKTNPEFFELHTPNIGERHCHEVLRIVGPQPWRSRAGYPEIKKALRRFIVAYGYNPSHMSWSEVIALWRGGPKLLEEKRLEIAMGRYDNFEDY